MPCYHPMQGWKASTVNPSTGKRSVTFRASEAFLDLPVQVTCGRCVGCRLERSRQWACRCVHHAGLYDENCFITLTYDDAHLPFGGTLVKKHFQDFMKRLRKKHGKRKISYYHCGEYGESCRVCRRSERFCTCPAYIPGPGRPHYHACVFNLSFPDQVLYDNSDDGSPYYTSESLSELWPLGFSTVGSMSFATAAYVARYVMKKINGEPAADHYRIVLPETGEIVNLLPEYTSMSLKPAIAKDWYGRFNTDVYPDDFIVMNGKKMKPPKYFDRLHELAAPEAHELIKRGRVQYAATQKENATPERMAVRETVKLSQLASLKRKLQ